VRRRSSNRFSVFGKDAFYFGRVFYRRGKNSAEHRTCRAYERPIALQYLFDVKKYCNFVVYIKRVRKTILEVLSFTLTFPVRNRVYFIRHVFRCFRYFSETQFIQTLKLQKKKKQNRFRAHTCSPYYNIIYTQATMASGRRVLFVSSSSSPRRSERISQACDVLRSSQLFFSRSSIYV